MDKMKIGIQLYSLRRELAEDYFGVFEKVKEMGYDGVELAGLYGYNADEVRARCGKIGIIPFSAHVLHTELMENPGLMKEYAEIGCEYMVIPYLSEEYRPGAAKFSEFLRDARILGERANELGMKLCYHNHEFEFGRIGGEYGLDVIYRDIPKEILKTEFDTCWIKYMGENPCEYIKKYADRTEIVHFKDYAVTDNNGIKEIDFRCLGDGEQDMEAMIAASKEIGMKWIIVEQDEPAKNKTPFECAEENINYLKMKL